MKYLLLVFIYVFAFGFNHLANSDSEYLKEHALNPVDWYPWEKQAFIKAKKENKLIFVSIGYSTCHWCHVMVKESFSTKQVANLLNKNYISISVDKEQLPQIDRYYQWVYLKLYHHTAGWPLNLILLPNKKVVFITNYIPKKNFFAKKGFLSLLPYYAKLWKTNPKFLLKKAYKIEQILNKKFKIKSVKNDLLFLQKQINKKFDFKYGGFKGMHKFPEYNKFTLLFDIYLLSKNKKYLNILNKTLTNMAKSGMYDQIEGGFFRYSVYDDFSIPHFEKMLYSNALMIQFYSRIYRYTKNPLYKKIVIQTIHEFNTKYRAKDGLFFAASSADSPNEGDYFCFSKKEIFLALKNIPDKKSILDYINFDKDGNFDINKNHIFFKYKIPRPKNLTKFLHNLRKIRKTHKFPFIDKKKILSWNAMMVNGLLEASYINPKYQKEAITLLNKILVLFQKNGIYYHSFVKKFTNKANLEDYAYLVRALIKSYEITHKKNYLKLANKFIQKALKFKHKKWFMSNNFPATIEEKSYPSALSVLFNDFIDFSSLENNFNLYEFTFNELKNYPLSLNYSYLAIAKLKIKYFEYIVKSKNIKNMVVMYPFVLYKKTNYDFYQICTIFSCMKTANNIKEIKDFFLKI